MFSALKQLLTDFSKPETLGSNVFTSHHHQNASLQCRRLMINTLSASNKTQLLYHSPTLPLSRSARDVLGKRSSQTPLSLTYRRLSNLLLFVSPATTLLVFLVALSSNLTPRKITVRTAFSLFLIFIRFCEYESTDTFRCSKV